MIASESTGSRPLSRSIVSTVSESRPEKSTGRRALDRHAYRVGDSGAAKHEQLVARKQQLLAVAIERQRADQLGRVGLRIDREQRPVLDREDRLAVGLDQVGLVDTGLLDVGPGEVLALLATRRRRGRRGLG